MKRAIPTIIFAILCSICAAQSQTPPTTFRRYSVENGLTQNSVWCLMRDSEGYMWIGTKDGLNRFDGIRFKVYRHDLDDPTSIGNNFIRSIAQVTTDTIWVGTDNGLYALCDEKFTPIQLPDTDLHRQVAVNAIQTDASGQRWVAVYGQGIWVYNPVSRLWTKHGAGTTSGSLPSSFVWCLLRDSDGIMWAGTMDGLARFNADTGKFTTYNTDNSSIGDNRIYVLYEDPNSNFWIGTWKGLRRLNRINEQFATCHGIPEGVVRAMGQTGTGSYFVGGNKGLFVYDASRDRGMEVYATSLTNPTHNDAVYAILNDSQGGIWIGGYFLGLHYHHPAFDTFRTYSCNQLHNRIDANAISDMVQDSDSNLWIATEDNGLARQDAHTGAFTYYGPSNGLSDYNLHALLSLGSDLWIGTLTSGIDRLDTSSGRIVHYGSDMGLTDPGVFSLESNDAGDIYAGTFSGIFVKPHDSPNFKRMPSPRVGYVYDLCVDHSGCLWIGTYGNGLYSYNPRLRIWKHYLHHPQVASSLPSDKVICIYCTRQDGTLWVGTEGGGAARLNEEADTFTRLCERNGLPNNVVYGILDDDAGNIWVSTNHGLACLRHGSHPVITFGANSGLQSDQFNYRSSLRSTSGESLYFGGICGFNVITPGAIPFGRKASQPRITSHRHPFTVAYGNNDVCITFSAMDYAFPEKYNYQYRLRGLSDDWRDCGNETTLNLANLPDGHYNVEVRTRAPEGTWSDPSLPLALTVTPPPYRSSMAYMLYLLLGAAMLWVLIRYLLGKNNRRHSREISEIEDRRARELYDKQLAYFRVIADEFAQPDGADNIQQQFRRIIEANMANPEFDMRTMASMLHLSYSGMHRRVKEFSGLSPNEYLRAFRLKRAAALLADGNHKIQEVCYLTGFNTPSYFTKCFQGQFGVTPKEFVARMQH